MVATVNTHHVFAFQGSGSRNLLESVVTIGHSVDFRVGEQTESVRRNDIFTLNSVLSLFSSIFGSLFSLSLGVEVGKLTGFDLSNFGIFS